MDPWSTSYFDWAERTPEEVEKLDKKAYWDYRQDAEEPVLPYELFKEKRDQFRANLGVV